VRRFLPVLVALAAVAIVVVTYLALGGASYKPTKVADPCVTREWRNPGSLQQVAEQIVLSGLDGAACDLGVSREELMLALANDRSLEAFAAEHGRTRADAEQAVRTGLLRAVDDAGDAKALPAFALTLVRAAVERIPPRRILELLEQLPALTGGLR
jgi:hypothetical protein